MENTSSEKIKNSNRKTWRNTPDSIKKERFKKISAKRTGQSTTGKVNWSKVNQIRRLWANRNSKKAIRLQFPELSQYTINDIISNRTWKAPVVPIKTKTDF